MFKVRCINNEGMNQLENNKIYEVERTYENIYVIKNSPNKVDGGHYYKDRFTFDLTCKEKKKAEVWTRLQINNTLKFGIDAYKCIFNDKATIMFYYSTLDYIPVARKIVAKCKEGDKFSKEDGLRICVLKAMKREIERELKQY